METKQKEERKVIKSAKQTKEGSRAASSLLMPIGNIPTWAREVKGPEPEVLFTKTESPISTPEPKDTVKTQLFLEDLEDGDGWDTDLEEAREYISIGFLYFLFFVCFGIVFSFSKTLHLKLIFFKNYNLEHDKIDARQIIVINAVHLGVL